MTRPSLKVALLVASVFFLGWFPAAFLARIISSTPGVDEHFWVLMCIPLFLFGAFAAVALAVKAAAPGGKAIPGSATGDAPDESLRAAMLEGLRDDGHRD
jgi:hypothetical protein